MDDKLQIVQKELVNLAQHVPPDTVEKSIGYLYNVKDIINTYEDGIKKGLTQEDCDMIEAAVHFATK